MSEKEYKWDVESCVNKIWQQCCVRSTTRQKIYIERCVNRLLKQIRKEVTDNLWKDNKSTEENINEVFDKYIK